MAEDVLQRIYKTITWLENIEVEKFSIAEMASLACLSPYHFSRVFTSMTGMPPALYYRRRMLTKAAQDLQKIDHRILDIALEYGYESHEAYTRAFKKMFKINPDDVKKINNDLEALYQKPLNIETLHHFKNDGLTIKPDFRSHPKRYIAGCSALIDFDDFEKANQVWLDYFKHNQQNKEKYYGVCQGTMNGDVPSAQLSYMAGHEAEKGIEIGDGDYAVFTHRGALQNVSTTLQYIWQIWVMRSGVFLRNAPDFEIYDNRFDQKHLIGDIEIWIPVTKG